MDFVTVPTIKAGHNRLRTGLQTTNIALCMVIKQLLLTNFCIALINAVSCGTVANKVFYRTYDMAFIQKVFRNIALQTFHDSSSIVMHDLRVFGVAFVGTAPAHITGNRNRRRENPVNTSDHHLGRCNTRNVFNQLGIVCRTQTNVMREYGCA